jgi:hypothetical protein
MLIEKTRPKARLPQVHRLLFRDPLVSSHALNRRCENVIVEAIVIPKREVCNVKWQVFCANFVERTDNPALEDAPKASNGLSVHRTEDAPARVSKDGRESLRGVHPSRRLLRKLLRMAIIPYLNCVGESPYVWLRRGGLALFLLLFALCGVGLRFSPGSEKARAVRDFVEFTENVVIGDFDQLSYSTVPTFQRLELSISKILIGKYRNEFHISDFESLISRGSWIGKAATKLTVPDFQVPIYADVSSLSLAGVLIFEIPSDFCEPLGNSAKLGSSAASSS